VVETGNVSLRAKQTFFVCAPSDFDVERICREYSEEEYPPQALIVTSELIAGQLLAISLEFLAEGQQLPWPGQPLAGATFGPDWGFSQVEVGMRSDGSAEFRLPSVHFENLANGDIWGYRLCIIDPHEVAEAVQQVARIRAELAQRHSERKRRVGVEIAITHL
jgi:hypothetical protein